jgi:hypothetical protein
MKTINRMAVGLAAGVLGALALATPANAQDEHFPDAGWLVREIALGSDVWADASASVIVDATTVDLTKPVGTTGTSIETTDLGLAVTAGDTIAVSYELLDGADIAAGAIRMFYYDHADGDTLLEAPTVFVAADGSGTLSLTVLADGQVGTMGLVYDASNVATGTVRFTDLTVGYTTVLFVEPAPPCEWNPDLAADDEECQPPSSPSPSPTTSEPPAGGTGGSDDAGKLPTTGAALPLFVGGGAALFGLGAGLWLLARRRPVTFTSGE